MREIISDLPLIARDELPKVEYEANVDAITRSCLQLINNAVFDNEFQEANDKNTNNDIFNELLNEKFENLRFLTKPSDKNDSIAEAVIYKFSEERERLVAKTDAQLDTIILDSLVLPSIIVNCYPNSIQLMNIGSDHAEKSAQIISNRLREKPHEDLVMHNFGKLYEKHGEYKRAFIELKVQLKMDGWDPEEYGIRDHPEDHENGYDNFRKKYKRWLKKQ